MFWQLFYFLIYERSSLLFLDIAGYLPKSYTNTFETIHFAYVSHMKNIGKRAIILLNFAIKTSYYQSGYDYSYHYTNDSDVPLL